MRVALLIVLAGCAGPAEDTGAVDGDGDGYPAGEDCDDGDAEVRPGAPEQCNGLDDDCDGSVDEDPEVEPVYLDQDGDGWGSGPGVRTCQPDEGYTRYGDDCDDADPDIHPWADELCDDAGVDEDCDGLIDAQDPSVLPRSQTTWYADSDGDGFGDPTTTALACVLPGGYTADRSDCDDTVVDGAPQDGCGQGGLYLGELVLITYTEEGYRSFGCLGEATLWVDVDADPAVEGSFWCDYPDSDYTAQGSVTGTVRGAALDAELDLEQSSRIYTLEGSLAIADRIEARVGYYPESGPWKEGTWIGELQP